MARGKSLKPTPGQHVKVVEGATMPEFPDLPIAGWTGLVLETTGTGAKLKVILEWDEPTQVRIPENYRAHCESQGLMHTMACLPSADLEVQ